MLTGQRPPPQIDGDVTTLGRGERRPYERNESIHALFRTCLERTPDALAVRSETIDLSYADVEARATRLSAHLRAIGVQRGTTVGVSLERSVELPVALLAILKAGAAYVALDGSFPSERLQFIIDDAAIETIVTGRRERANLPPGTSRIVDVDAEADAIAATPGLPDVACDGRTPAYITYTSGSTGRPKGVAIDHRGVLRLVRNSDYVTIESHDVFLHYAPLAFDASTFEIWAPLLNGAGVAIPRPGLLSAAELSAAIERNGVTTLFLTTSLFGRFVEHGDLARAGSLRCLLTGGEVASPDHMLRFLRALPRCRLLAVYGPTENTTFSTWLHLDSAETIGTNVPIGRPIANSSAYVLDENLRPVPLGTVGELCVGGDGVARGYVNLPELTRERFVADPFSAEAGATLYRTGDRARLRPDGILEFLGRNDDQVKLRGFRIELGEIEFTLQARDDVAAVAVVLGTAAGEKALFAYVVPAGGAVANEGALREYLKAKLPSFAIPQRFVFLEALPHQPSGKVDRVALSRRAVSPVSAPSASAPTFSAGRKAGIAATIAAAWCEALGVDDVDPDTNFFDAGGNSLQIMGLHVMLARNLGIKFGIGELFEHTTIRKLAARLSSLPSG